MYVNTLTLYPPLHTHTQVQNFLYHFWQGMPSHLHPILATDIVTDLIAVCDTILYKAISSVYITTPLQSIPEKYVSIVRCTCNLVYPLLENGRFIC